MPPFGRNVAPPGKAARCGGCPATNVPPLLTSFTGQGDAQQEPMGKLQSSLRVPELRHYECTTIRHQGLAGDDARRVGKVCQLALRRPGGRLPDRGLERAGEVGGGEEMQRGNRWTEMHFALNKATDFISKPWHTYLGNRSVAGTLQYVPIQQRTAERV